MNSARTRHVRARPSASQVRKEARGEHRAAALNTIVEQMMLSDPEFRELMTEILGEMAGTRFEGLRTLDPGEAAAQAGGEE